jgi:hypothetical protein
MLLWAGPALAQGCAMCYSSATGTTKEGQRAISRGVLVLLVPPVSFMTLGVGLAFRYSKKRDQAQLRAENQELTTAVFAETSRPAPESPQYLDSEGDRPTVL